MSFYKALRVDCGSGNSVLCVELERTNTQIDKLYEDKNGKLNEVQPLILKAIIRH